MIKSLIDKARRVIRNSVQELPVEYRYDTLPPESIKAAARIPMVRYTLQKFSEDEYDVNPHYQLVINNIVNHTIGPQTKIIAHSDKIRDDYNDLVEDAYLQWGKDELIGRAYRDIRREAARSGIGIGIPFYDKQSDSPNPLKYKVYGGLCLKSPVDAGIEDRIIDGIQYDSNWEPEKFFILDTNSQYYRPHYNEVEEYDASSVLYFCRNTYRGLLWPLPECYGAFSIYPYLRRYLQAVIEQEEFRKSFPLAVELDPKVYTKWSQSLNQTTSATPFIYEPGMIPTLPPGMKLSGLPNGLSGKQVMEIMELFATTCAMTVQMPKNLAVANSDNANMAASQVDIQPWANKIQIDRCDLEPTLRKSFKQWWQLARYNSVPRSVLRAHTNFLPHTYIYQDLFEHPDPNKRASARKTDLASGSTTLNLVYSQRGLNFKREIAREAKALGITFEEMVEIILSSRSTQALTVLRNERSEHANSKTAYSGTN